MTAQQRTIYLGGAFAQFSAEQVRARQSEVEAHLPKSIHLFHPQHRDDYDPALGPESIGRLLTTRDYEMVRRCDLLMLDVLGAQTASGGSFIEIGWASEMKKPVVLIAEEDNIHRHVMALNLITAAVATRQQAAAVATKLLGLS